MPPGSQNQGTFSGGLHVANSDYSELLGDVLPYLAADPSDPVTEGAIKRAVIEFCSQTGVWLYPCAPMNVEAGVLTYQLTPPIDAMVVGVADVFYDGHQIDAKSFASLNATKPGWMTNHGTPDAYTQVESDRLILAPLPSANLAGGLVFTLKLAPTYDAISAPAWLLSKYRNALAEGALSRLMLMPNKPWTDTQNGIDRRTRFESHIANAIYEATTGTAAAVIRTTPQH